MAIQRVEIEFIKGNDEWRERRIFERAEIVEFNRPHTLYVSSQSEGSFFINLNESRLVWFSAEPIGNLADRSSANEDIKRALSTNVGIIPAVKLCRELLGYSLKEAKEYVEKLRDMPNIDDIPLDK